MTKYSLIAAIADNLVIGNGNRMPWHVPGDLKKFRELTWGNIIIMGRKTFDSIGSPLPGRQTIIVTRAPEEFSGKQKSGLLTVCDSLDSALLTAAEISEQSGQEKKVLIAGGASIYAQAIDGAENLFLSRIPGEYEGDAFFPEFRDGTWVLDKAEEHDKFRFEVYRRKK